MKRKSKTLEAQFLAAPPIPQTPRQKNPPERTLEEFHRNAALAGFSPEPVLQHFNDHIDMNIAPEMAVLELEKAEINSDKAWVDKRLSDVNDRLCNTPPTIRSNEGQSKSFYNWETGHQIAFSSLFAFLMTMLGVAGSNVYVALMASGEPVFLDNPALAVMLSLLAPAGAMALKFVSHCFEDHRGKKRFAVGIYLLSALVFLLWIFLFARSYSVTGGIDLNSLLNTEAKGPWLLFVQMLGEILVAASLTLAMQQIHLVYNPISPVDNPVYLDLLKQRDALVEERDKLSKKLVPVITRFTELERARTVASGQEIARYSAEIVRRAANDF